MATWKTKEAAHAEGDAAVSEQPNYRGALLWNGGVIVAGGTWGYVAARLNLPAVSFIVFAIAISAAAFVPPDRFKLWPGH